MTIRRHSFALAAALLALLGLGCGDKDKSSPKADSSNPQLKPLANPGSPGDKPAGKAAKQPGGAAGAQ